MKEERQEGSEGEIASRRTNGNHFFIGKVLLFLISSMINPSLVHSIIFGCHESVIFPNDKARPHVANARKQKFGAFDWEILEYSPNSLDLSPFDFHLFGPLKERLRGKRFDDGAAVKTFVRQRLQERPKKFYDDRENEFPWQENM